MRACFLERKKNYINLQTTNNGLIEMSDLRTNTNFGRSHFRLYTLLDLIDLCELNVCWLFRVLEYKFYFVLCLFSVSAVKEFCLRIEIRLIKMLNVLVNSVFLWVFFFSNELLGIWGWAFKKKEMKRLIFVWDGKCCVIQHLKRISIIYSNLRVRHSVSFSWKQVVWAKSIWSMIWWKWM